MNRKQYLDGLSAKLSITQGHLGELIILSSSEMS